jgi:hypothetical protein
MMAYRGSIFTVPFILNLSARGKCGQPYTPAAVPFIKMYVVN